MVVILGPNIGSRQGTVEENYDVPSCSGTRFCGVSLGAQGAPAKDLEIPLDCQVSGGGSVLQAIAQASVVDDDVKLTERVEFVQKCLNTDVIAEQYIEGRELYVGLLGNHRLQVFPTWELNFERMSADSLNIATAKVKFDEEYQKKHGLT
ncbi:MAG: hypothetical protein R3C68_02585 [Myxococcota bacterium]